MRLSRQGSIETGAEAPKEVPVHRKEIADAIEKSKTENQNPLTPNENLAFL